MNVLVINCGSSSLKFQLINSDTEAVLAKGLCERIGIDGRLTYQPEGGAKEVNELAMPTHTEAIQFVINALTNPETGVVKSLEEIDAVGHRLVHGGEKFAGLQCLPVGSDIGCDPYILRIPLVKKPQHHDKVESMLRKSLQCCLQHPANAAVPTTFTGSDCSHPNTTYMETDEVSPTEDGLTYAHRRLFARQSNQCRSQRTLTYPLHLG